MYLTLNFKNMEILIKSVSIRLKNLFCFCNKNYERIGISLLKNDYRQLRCLIIGRNISAKISTTEKKKKGFTIDYRTFKCKSGEIVDSVKERD